MAQCTQCGKKGLLVKINAFGLCESCAQGEIDRLRKMMTPEMQDAAKMQQYIQDLQERKSIAEQELAATLGRVEDANRMLALKQTQIVQTDEQILMQEFGLYEPRYDFCNSDEYKNHLIQIRQKQKDLIKCDRAVYGNMNWTVNGSTAQGKKMVKDMQKLLLRAFNSECDSIVEKVKYNNYDASLKRISTSRDAISKLGNMMDVSITDSYYQLKIDELTLALEYQQQKQREKEAQKRSPRSNAGRSQIATGDRRSPTQS